MLDMNELTWTAVGMVYVVVGLVVVLVSKYVMNLLTPYRIDEELTKKDNPALGLAIAGYFGGVLIILLGAAIGPDPESIPPLSELARALGADVLYALGGIVALNLGRFVVDRLVLHNFSVKKEIITDRNVGAGAVECACFLTTALIVAGAIHGEGDVISALVFFVLGQVVLVLFSRFYQWITPYDIHKEIEADNVAAGARMGFGIVAIGIILLKATMGDFVSWEYNLTRFALYAAVGLAMVVLLQFLVDRVLFPGTTLKHEITVDRNMNVAWIEGTLTMGVAAMVFFLV